MIVRPVETETQEPKEGELAVFALGSVGDLWAAKSVTARVSNTGGANSKRLADGEKLDLRCGIDWLKLYCYGRGLPSHDRERLREAKEQVQKRSEPVYLRIGALDWEVLGHGTGKGSNHFDYLVRRDGVTVGIADREHSMQLRETRAVCMIEAPGSVCCGRNPKSLVSDLCTALESMGFLLTNLRASRLDLHVDVHGLRLLEVVRAMTEQRVVNRSRSWRTHAKGADLQTIEIGSKESSCSLCIYDKRAELATNAVKEVLYQERFHMEQIGDVTRFEFRLSGDCLREIHHVGDHNDLLVKLPKIARWCVNDWFRIVSRPVTNQHYDVPLDQTWAEVSEFFELGMISEEGEPLPAQPKIPKPVKLSQQVRGCLASMFAALGLSEGDSLALLKGMLSSMVRVASTSLPDALPAAEAAKDLLSRDVDGFQEKCRKRLLHWMSSKGAIVRKMEAAYDYLERLNDELRRDAMELAAVPF